ncbi:uncharacterized protein LOC142975052 [Anticarsia gemmatalis]|uniref:uncharacterized protein LOC142975052 n=1 Tax=Anticarsia gemmatalis TaxID=129554 RepID=UPI003F75CB96
MTEPFKVWSKFSVTKGTETFKFKMMEPPIDRLDDVMDLVYKYFMKEESIFKAAGVPKGDQEALKAEYELLVTGYISDELFHTTVCCVDNDNEEIGEIVGASFMTLTKKNTPLELQFHPQSKELLKAFEMILTLPSLTTKMDELNIDQYYDGRGVVVSSKYRGCGIAQEFLKVRRLVCKEKGVPLTCAMMTAIGTQKAAERDGWQTMEELDFEEFGKLHGVSFEGSPKIAKLMAVRID